MDRTRRAPGGTGLKEVAAESLGLAGGGRALLLQIAHPAVGRGVAEHSDFGTRPLERLHATMTFICAAIFATPEEFATLRRHVNRAHARVRADAAGGAPGYNAYDPRLQLWVAATVYRTMTELYERVFGALDAADAESVYRDFTRLGLNLQVPESLWPPTRAAFSVYWDEMLQQLAVTDSTRAVAAQILHPANAPLWLRPLLPDARLATAGLLPDVVREAYGLPWDDRSSRRFERRMRLVTAVYPLLPRRVRYGVRDGYLRRMRRMLAA